MGYSEDGGSLSLSFSFSKIAKDSLNLKKSAFLDVLKISKMT